MRLGTCLALAVAGLAAAGSAGAASPPRPAATGIDVWGQPDRSLEVAGRPLGTTIALFGRGTSATLPTPSGLMRPLSLFAAHMRGDPGALMPRESRRVITETGPVYLVPTTHGWLCIQGPTFQTCHRGLLRQGVTWSFYSTSTGLDVIGIAANNVSAVALTWRGSSRPAQLAHNVFFVHRPLSIASVKHLPPLGRLAVTYRGSKARTTVPIH